MNKLRLAQTLHASNIVSNIRFPPHAMFQLLLVFFKIINNNITLHCYLKKTTIIIKFNK